MISTFNEIQKYTYKDWSDLIKTLRTWSNMSQRVLGNKVGVSGKTISAYENGRCRVPVDTLEGILAVFNHNIVCMEMENKADASR